MLQRVEDVLDEGLHAVEELRVLLISVVEGWTRDIVASADPPREEEKGARPLSEGALPEMVADSDANGGNPTSATAVARSSVEMDSKLNTLLTALEKQHGQDVSELDILAQKLREEKSQSEELNFTITLVSTSLLSIPNPSSHHIHLNCSRSE
jgi:hypothetical protein